MVQLFLFDVAIGTAISWYWQGFWITLSTFVVVWCLCMVGFAFMDL